MPHTTNKTLAQAERIMLVCVLLSNQYTGSNQTRERSFQAACMEQPAAFALEWRLSFFRLL